MTPPVPRHRRGLLLASVLVALPSPVYAWAVGAGTPPAAAAGTGQLLLALALAAHTWSLRPLCRSAARALGWAVAVLVVAVVLVGGLTEIVFDLYTRTSVAGEIGGLVAGVLAGLLLPLPVHLVLGVVLRRHLRPPAVTAPRAPRRWRGARLR